MPAKRIVITGASSGIGQATVLRFAADGANIVIAARGVPALEEVACQCREAGGTAIVVPIDVTDAGAVQALADRASAQLGQIDLWFSNVGVGAVGLFHETPIEAHARIIEANLIGHINDAHAALPIFLNQDYGIFVNMISLGGFAAAPFATAYSASKFGLRGFAEALRAELADYTDIHICDVYPSFVDTPGLSHGANYVGKKVTVPPPLVDPRRVAEAVYRLADHPQATTMVGASTAAVRMGHFLAPNLSARAMDIGLKRYFETAKQVPVSDGNLFAPPSDPGGIDGGMGSPAARKAGIGLAAAAAVVAAGGVGAWLLRGSRQSSEPSENDDA